MLLKRLFFLFLISISCGAVFADNAPSDDLALPVVPPETLSLDPVALDRIDSVIQSGIDEGDYPGAVVAIGRGNQLGFLRAYGNRQVEPSVEPTTPDTIYDLASLTKVTSTALAIAILVERGEIEYDAPVAKYLPEFGENGKENVTVRDCLTHVSGLTPDNSLNDYLGFDRAGIFANICKLSLRSAPGEKFAYSDVGFIVLGYLVEKISGVSQDEFVRENIYRPLGMFDSGYNLTDAQKSRAASAEKRAEGDADWIKGEVHDPRAYAMEGVAGHAGNFSTASDLAILSAMLLGRGTYRPASAPEKAIRIISGKTFALMTEPLAVPGGIRSRGWDKRSDYSGNRAVLMSPSSFGHSGFTGTSIWIDPDLDLFVIVLTNRLHPDGKGGANAASRQIGAIAVDAIRDSIDCDAAKAFVKRSVYRSPNAPSDSDVNGVLTGADVLDRDGYSLLKGRRVGLLTNHTGVMRDGRRLPKALQDGGVELTALFSPEHGLYGALDQANIESARDEETGLTVYSLYGDTRRPTPEMLKDVDVFVFDIQDVGARFYTYISAMALAMQTCADLGKSFVVLDRPNPIGGVEVAGSMLDPGRESYVAFFPIPIQHGMTVGELALMFANRYQLGLDLTVVPCENWSRGEYYDETGLNWINPSPNMRSLTAALIYPGLGLPEFTNLSVGRGTETPFELFGAPWIDAEDLAAKTSALGLLGVEFEPIAFTPTASRYSGEECKGLRVRLTDRKSFRAVSFGLALMSRLARDYPDAWDRTNANTLLLSDATLGAIESGADLKTIEEALEKDVARFKEERANYLIYGE